MLGKTPLWKDLLIDFAYFARSTSLICFITFLSMLLGPVATFHTVEIRNYVRYHFISSGCDEKWIFLDLGDSLHKIL